MAVSSNPKVGYLSFATDINEVSCRALINNVNQMIIGGFTELHLLLATGGGSVMYGFTIYNTLTGMPVKLVTHNVANVDSIGNVIFLAGSERIACPNSTFMFHGVAWPVQTPNIDGPKSREVVANIDADERRISAVVAARTNLDVSEVDTFFHEAASKDAQYALQAGIVHSVAAVSIPPGTPLIVVG